nr:hypothetical protein [Tanacetum cinerariifolium]
MLEKDLHDSWKSRMELYMQNREHREHGRMIHESLEHGPLIWLTIEEYRVTRTKKYTELSSAKKLQADCDMNTTNIILQGDDPIACLYKAMDFLTTVASSRGTMQVDMQGLLNATIVKIEELDTYDSDCDDISNAKAVLMDNIFNYDLTLSQ